MGTSVTEKPKVRLAALVSRIALAMRKLKLNILSKRQQGSVVIKMEEKCGIAYIGGGNDLTQNIYG